MARGFGGFFLRGGGPFPTAGAARIPYQEEPVIGTSQYCQRVAYGGFRV